MPNTKKLLSITNLKKYFPIAKSSIFQKEQLYVRANEDISLDIYEGETIGIVGESGCGKSTLGRVLLQLYDQTAGTTVYYGVPRAEVAPKYVLHTLKHVDKYISKLHAAQAHADALTKKADELGDNASFFDLQKKNLAIAEYQTAQAHISKILGGFVVADTDAGAALLYKKALIEDAAAALSDKIRDIDLEISDIDAANDEKNAAKAAKKRASLVSKRDKLAGERDVKNGEIAELDSKIAELKKPHANDPEFMRPRMTVGQIIEEGLVAHKMYKHGSPLMKEHILNVMRQCGLQDYMLHRYPHQFSGGQRQRISIARALAVHPKFVVCDECVSALDVSIQSQIINLLQELKEKEHLTYMFISHDLSVVRYISDRICVMYLGNVVELGDAATIFDDPRHPYTVALLSSIPTTDIESLKKERILLEGNIPSPIKPPSGCKFHTRCYMACDKCKRVPPELREIEPGHFVACHFPEKKIDSEGNYLFKLPSMAKKSVKDLD